MDHLYAFLSSGASADPDRPRIPFAAGHLCLLANITLRLSLLTQDYSNPADASGIGESIRGPLAGSNIYTENTVGLGRYYGGLHRLTTVISQFAVQERNADWLTPQFGVNARVSLAHCSELTIYGAYRAVISQFTISDTTMINMRITKQLMANSS